MASIPISYKHTFGIVTSPKMKQWSNPISFIESYCKWNTYNKDLKICSGWITGSSNKCPRTSVTRFHELLPLWQYAIVFGNFLRVNFIFGQIALNLLWLNCEDDKQIFIVENGQILRNNQAIWSHCSEPKMRAYLPRNVYEKEW